MLRASCSVLVVAAGWKTGLDVLGLLAYRARAITLRDQPGCWFGELPGRVSRSVT